MSAPALELDNGVEAVGDGDGQRYEVCSEATSGWTRRVRIGKAPDEREMNPDRKTTLELSVCAYAENREGHVISPKLAQNLTRLMRFWCTVGKKQAQCAKDEMHARDCVCMRGYGTPLKENSCSSRCGCNAMIRLLRSKDGGWYISEHKSGHNHPLSITCGQKMHWKSHRHIDRYIKDLVKQLRDNNVGVGKVFSIVGSFFGAAENVPFTKRSLKTLCRKLNREQSDFDAVKTMNMLAEMKANDPDFNYTVQVDEESRIKTLMWVTSRGCDQYMCFGDAITFDTTYRTNLYDMPFGLFVGVNNHFQSIIFGGAMMRDEKEEHSSGSSRSSSGWWVGNTRRQYLQTRHDLWSWQLKQSCQIQCTVGANGMF